MLKEKNNENRWKHINVYNKLWCLITNKMSGMTKQGIYNCRVKPCYNATIQQNCGIVTSLPIHWVKWILRTIYSGKNTICLYIIGHISYFKKVMQIMLGNVHVPYTSTWVHPFFLVRSVLWLVLFIFVLCLMANGSYVSWLSLRFSFNFFILIESTYSSLLFLLSNTFFIRSEWKLFFEIRRNNTFLHNLKIA
jgi:hypothetical protein